MKKTDRNHLKEQFRKEVGPFGLRLLKGDLKLVINSWKGYRKSKKHFKELYKKGLISKETYRNILSGKLNFIYDKNSEFFDLVLGYFVKYSNPIIPTNKLDYSVGIDYIKPEKQFKSVHFKFEGSFDPWAENGKYSISLSQGTLNHCEALAILYGTVAGTVPDLKRLKEYYNHFNKVFVANLSMDDRPLLEKIVNPNDAHTVGIKFLQWQQDLNEMQGLLAFDLIKALKLFLIGHEFAHLLHELCDEKPYEQYKAEKFCKKNNLAINPKWLEEFSCDVIGLKLAMRFLKDTAYHKETNGVHNSKTINLQNPISFLLSRDISFNNLLHIEYENEMSKKSLDIDIPVLMISAVKIFFWNFIDLTNDSSSDTHPPPSERLNFLIEDMLATDIPKDCVHLTNSLNVLKKSLETEIRSQTLDHPYSTDLNKVV